MILSKYRNPTSMRTMAAVVAAAVAVFSTTPALHAEQEPVEEKKEAKEEEKRELTADEKEAKKKEDLERLSEALEKFAEPERRKRTDQMQSVLADIKRAANLDEDQQKELSLAVKGAVEHSLSSWKKNYQRYAESRFQSSENIDEVIKRLGRVSFGSNAKEQPKNQSVWFSSVKRILTPEQSARYEKVVAERRAFQQEAVARSLVAHVDSQCSLTGEQREQVMALVAPVVEENFEGLSSIYGGEMRNLYYQLGIFLNGVEEDKAKEILSEQQLRSWKEIASQNSSMWDSVISKTKEIAEARKEAEEELKKMEDEKKGKGEGADKEKAAADAAKAAKGAKEAKEAANAGQADKAEQAASVAKEAAEKKAGEAIEEVAPADKKP